MVPPESITSLRAKTCSTRDSFFPATLYSTPVATPFSMRMRSHWAPVMTVRLGRSLQAARKVRAVLWRRPLRILTW